MASNNLTCVGKFGRVSQQAKLISHLQDDVILLLQPESFRICFLVYIGAFVN